MRDAEMVNFQLSGNLTLVRIPLRRASVALLARHPQIVVDARHAKCRGARRTPFTLTFSLQNHFTSLDSAEQHFLRDAVISSCCAVEQKVATVQRSAPATH